MSSSAFIRRGNGYSGCTAFDGFTVIAAPLPDRDLRVFRRPGALYGVTYDSYSLSLARNQGGDLALLIEHGAGREVLVLASVAGEESGWVLQIECERARYAALWTLYQTARCARDESRDQTARQYVAAFTEGRLKKRRRAGRLFVEISDAWIPTIDGADAGAGCKTSTAAWTAAKALAAERGGRPGARSYREGVAE